MEIILGKNIGFCFGVKRAYDLSLKIAKQSNKFCFCLGPLVHNESVIEKLQKLGIKTISSLDDIKDNHSGDPLIIPAHGAKPETFSKAKAKGLEIIDATCPLVKKVQEAARELQNNGYNVIIIGDKNHTEVESIQGAIDDKGIVIENMKDIQLLNKKSLKNLPLGVVSQTTQSLENVDKILKELRKISKKIKFSNTLCPFVADRQKEVKKISQKVDLILIIGSSSSANTKRLADIAKGSKKPVYYIENENQLKKEWFCNIKKLGIFSGTSTPDWEIKKIINKIKNYEKK